MFLARQMTWNFGQYGIDSFMAPLNVRLQAWQRLAQHLDIAKALSQAIKVAAELLQWQLRGRVVVDVAGS